MMKAVILAGGQGTRLRPLTYTRTKPMIPFLNKPVMEHIVTKLAGQGFKEIIITTNYKAEQIRDYFHGGGDWGVELKVVNEGEPLGTAGSVKNAVDHLDETFAVVQGDSVSDIDVRELYNEHKRMGAMATMSLMEVDDVSHYGIAEMRGDEIIRFKEKPKKDETFSNLANDGIYILEPEVLDMIPLAFYDFSKNLFPRMLAEKKRICGSVTHAFWRDVGRPKDYMEATHHFLHQKNLVGEGSRIEGGHVVESVLGKGCSVREAEVRSSVLFDNVNVKKGSSLKYCIVGESSTVGESVDIWPGAVIGDDVEIGDGCVIKGKAQIGPGVAVAPGSTVNEVLLPDGLD